MPTFETPEPISATIELVVGHLRISASDRADTVVEVRPSNESDESDVHAAEQTRVEYSGGQLLVRAPKSRPLDFSNKSRSVDVTIELPSGSAVTGDAALADIGGTGRLGDCRVKLATGHVQFDHTGSLDLHTSAGNVSVGRIDGHAEVSTGSGKLGIGELRGSGVVKNSNGTCELGTVTGKLRLRTANGDLSVGSSADGLEAKTANGNIRVGEATGGPLALETGMGSVEVGIPAGTAAWLDAKTGYGRVDSDLGGGSGEPGPTDESIEVRARTAMGDIVIRRS
ncbi:DUF4097 family beta strand repeat-containing protein [Prauserella cavernicola]|uniref:DUF4097 family beta strand repeat protein n=1 Tax=Prauserella cavernicola TaxID=2800127 RepID=A0A934V3T8_9PSEU|nr:DUF4097 family beta strand repeat-containing protein [Prauserella cavernicola]MBK1783400.1 DUF4097 family beta strand repeat protein [Prauserella cavernicola]